MTPFDYLRPESTGSTVCCTAVPYRSSYYNAKRLFSFHFFFFFFCINEGEIMLYLSGEVMKSLVVYV